MSTAKTFVIDFIAKGGEPNEWKLVLVERDQLEPTKERLHRLQARLYNCLDAVLDGQLAPKYPETYGKRIVIQVEVFSSGRDEFEKFFSRFSKGVFAGTDYGDALKDSQFAKKISFEINFNEDDACAS